MALPVTIIEVDQLNRQAAGRSRPYKSPAGSIYAFFRGSLSGEGDEMKAYKTTNPDTTDFTEQDFVQEAGSSSWSNVATFREDDLDDEIVVVASTGAEDIFLHIFDTSTDTYTSENEQVTSAVTAAPFGYKVLAFSQETNGDVIVIYQGQEEDDMGLRQRIDYARRVGGTWTSNIAVDDGGKFDYFSSGIVRGVSDLFHITYYDQTNTNALHKSVQDVDGTLSAVETLSDSALATGEHLVNVPVYYDDGGTERITVAFRRSTGGSEYRSAEVEDDGTPLAAETVGSDIDEFTESSFDHAVGCLAVDQKTVWAIWVQGADDDIFVNFNVNSGGWDTETEEVATTTATGISSNIYERNGNIVLAYLWNDNGTDTAIYDERFLRVAAAPSLLLLNLPVENLEL